MRRSIITAAFGVATSLVVVGPVGAAPAAAATVEVSDNLAMIGHRGGITEAPENTMAAINNAIRSGAAGVEFDVRMTRDNAKVLLHDLTLNRTTDCTGRIDRKTWKQVKTCDAGSWFGRSFRGERVPSLNKALNRLSRTDLRIFLHIKDVDSRQDARSIMRSVKKNNVNSHTVLFASNTRSLRLLDAEGARRGQLGTLFSSPSGWKAHDRYQWLIPYNVPISKAKVREAQRDGHKVVAVEGHPLAVRDLTRLGLDGFMADGLHRALDSTGRLLR